MPGPFNLFTAPALPLETRRDVRAESTDHLADAIGMLAHGFKSATNPKESAAVRQVIVGGEGDAEDCGDGCVRVCLPTVWVKVRKGDADSMARDAAYEFAAFALAVERQFK